MSANTEQDIFQGWVCPYCGPGVEATYEECCANCHADLNSPQQNHWYVREITALRSELSRYQRADVGQTVIDMERAQKDGVRDDDLGQLTYTQLLDLVKQRRADRGILVDIVRQQQVRIEEQAAEMVATRTLAYGSLQRAKRFAMNWKRSARGFKTKAKLFRLGMLGAQEKLRAYEGDTDKVPRVDAELLENVEEFGWCPGCRMRCFVSKGRTRCCDEQAHKMPAIPECPCATWAQEQFGVQDTAGHHPTCASAKAPFYAWMDGAREVSRTRIEQENEKSAKPDEFRPGLPPLEMRLRFRVWEMVEGNAIEQERGFMAFSDDGEKYTIEESLEAARNATPLTACNMPNWSDTHLRPVELRAAYDAAKGG